MSTVPDASPWPAVPDDVAACVRALRDAAGEHLRAVIFFGSRLLGTSPDRFSAADLFVVVDSYLPFYRGMCAAGALHGRPRWLARLNRWLPPNVVTIGSSDGVGPSCKCFVIDRVDFAWSMSPRARDHFCRGRLVQTVALIHARDERIRGEVEGHLACARRETLRWVPDVVGETFTVDEYCRAMLRVSFASEFRPEAAARVDEVFEAQRAALSAAFDAVLREAGADHGVVPTDDGFRRLRRNSRWQRGRRRMWFARSRARAVVRWIKYVQTYDGWLDYALHKVERRTGLAVELTPAQRRWPFLLLWPTFFRVLRAIRRARRSKGAHA